ncbi:MAG: YraN family protein [Nocardioidaceae bacterium]
MTATHAQRKALGDFGERLAERHLVEAGLVVLDRNWRCAAGEIDIVARDGDVLVVCEVKTRSSDRFGTPLEAITALKGARLHRLAWAWVFAHGLRCRAVRVDVICVLQRRSEAARVEHVRGVA